MRVAVTGASGFVGGRLARALAALGHEVHAYGRRSPDAVCGSLPRYVVWDLTHGPLPHAPIVDALVHCAAHVGDWGVEFAYESANVVGTRHALTSFADARRIVHVSTSSVYSDSVPTVAVREDAPTGDCALSAYARSKARAERVVFTARPDAAVLRPHVVYGPGDATLLPRVLAARVGGVLPVPGDGMARLSCTHVDNLVHAVVCALEATGAAGAYNIADAETATVDALLTTLLARRGYGTRLLHVPAPVVWRVAAGCEALWGALGILRGPPLTRYAVGQLTAEHTLDCGRARAALAYRPRWTYRDGPLTGC